MLWYTAWLCYTVSCIVRSNCVASSFPPGDSFPIFVPCAHVCILVVFWSVSQSLRWRTYETPHCTGHDIFGDESGMSGTLGRVDEFDGDKDDWQQYVERLEHFFVANGIDGAEKKRAVFLSVIGSSTYKTFRNLSPNKPGEQSYADLVETLCKHFKPAPSEIVERFRFNSRVRRQGESVATFVAELRALAEFCNFRATLQAMLRDRIVCGVSDDAIQRRLLSESKLDYAKAVEIALNMETAAQSMKTLKGKSEGPASGGDGSAQPRVHKTSATPSKSGKFVPTCYRCGARGHVVSKCRVDNNVTCLRCRKRGICSELARARRRLTTRRPRPTTRQRPRPRPSPSLLIEWRRRSRTPMTLMILPYVWWSQGVLLTHPP